MTSLFLARCGLLRGRRGLSWIALIVAVFGGVTLAAVTGAHRTATAFSRLEAATRPYDLLVSTQHQDMQAERIAALPMVAHTATLRYALLSPVAPSTSLSDFYANSTYVASFTGAFADGYGVPLVREGRLPGPHSTDEVLVDQGYAESRHLRVGDVLTGRIYDDDEMSFLAGNGTRAHDEVVSGTSDPMYGTTYHVTVTGIGTLPDSFLYDSSAGSPIALWSAPTFAADAHPAEVTRDWLAVWLKDPAELAAFESSVAPGFLSPHDISYVTWPPYRDQVERALSSAAAVLWASAAITAALGLLLTGQAVSRRLRRESAQNWPLAVLGVTHRQRATASVLVVLPASCVGAVLALPIAYLLSAWTPVGLARDLELTPGMSFDAGLLGVGLIAIPAACVVAAAIPAWRSTRVRPRSMPLPPPTLSWLTVRRLPVSVSVGARYGLSRGRDGTAAQARVTLTAAITGVVVGVAALTFAASLDRAVTEAHTYGVSFSGVIVYDYWAQDGGEPLERDLRAQLLADPGVAGVSAIRTEPITINGLQVSTLALGGGGAVSPVLAEGRAPRAADEVALGALTMEQLGVGIGSEVSVVAPGHVGAARVVGRVVLPSLAPISGGDSTSTGSGAILLPEALGAPDPKVTQLAFTTRPDVMAADVASRIQAHWATGNMSVYLVDAREPADIQGLRSLGLLPLWLAAIVVALVTATVMLAVLQGIRQRRRELAVIRVAGARRRTVHAAGLWYSLSVMTVASIVGIPLGLALGRRSWDRIAAHYGILATHGAPYLEISVLVLALGGLAGLVGLVGARYVAARPLADMLRGE